MRNPLRWLLLVFFLISGCWAMQAQSVNAGDIRGTVTDPTGAVIPGTTITVLNVDTGVSKDFTTNEAGLYDTNSMVPGHYKITITHPGFQQEVRGPITLEVGFFTINAKLKLGSDKQQVVVTSDVPLLSTESGQQSTTMDAQTMDELPQIGGSAGNDWQNFVILLPGATGAQPGSNVGSLNAGTTNPGQGSTINGNLPYNNILADGASTTLPQDNNAQPIVFENVAELQVNTSTFSAQYGVGGVMFNQISKGGTSSYHGAAYDAIQNKIFAASQYEFNSGISSVSGYHYNNFGGAIGGPVPFTHKKAFFYFNYDQIINNGGGGTSVNSIPTADVLSGDFSAYTPAMVTAPGSVGTIIYDPTTQTLAQDVNNNYYPVRQPFLNNTIPSNLIDPLAQKFNQFFPTPTNHIPGVFLSNPQLGNHGQAVSNFVGAPPTSNPWKRYFGRFDWDITKNNRLSLSDTQSDNPAFLPSYVTACPIGCESQDVDNNNAQITDVWSINSHITNEARFGFTNQLNFFADAAQNKGYAAKLGWQYGVADDIPSIDFMNAGTDYAWIAVEAGYTYKEHVFDPSDVVTLIEGKHILHFGAEVLMYQNNAMPYSSSYNPGTLQFGGSGWGQNYDYTANWTLSGGVAIQNANNGWDFADYLLGDVNSWNASLSPEYAARLKSPQLFVQDDYKIRPNLTINVGLRYQYNDGWKEKNGNVAVFDPTVTNPATGTLGAMWYGSTAANGRKQVIANTKTTFLPRFGFSWLPKQNMTVRGGFGVYAYNLSLGNYGAGMGLPDGSSGSAQDPSNGIVPLLSLSGPGTMNLFNNHTGVTSHAPLPFTPASTDPARFNGQNVTGNMYYTPVPKILQWNLAIQRQFASNYVAEVAYVASHAMNLSFPNEANAIPQSELLSTGVNSAAIPYPQYNYIYDNSFNAVTNFNSLQLQLTKRMTDGLSFNVNYVWSHLLDSQDSAGGYAVTFGPQDWQNPYDVKGNYASSNFDSRHALKGNVVYQLPFGKGKKYLSNSLVADEVVGGWEFALTAVLSTGNPFTVVSGQGSTNNNTQGGAFYPNWSGVSTSAPHHPRCTVKYDGTGACPNTWYNQAAFLLPQNGTYGGVSRNALYGPGVNVFNMSAHKEFLLFHHGDRDVKFVFRADAANVFNHASFASPLYRLNGSPGPGQPYTTNGTEFTELTVGGRNMQVTGRVTF